MQKTPLRQQRGATIFEILVSVLILSFGIRFFGERLSADLGFFYPMSEGEGISEGFPFIPWLGFAYNFGN